MATAGRLRTRVLALAAGLCVVLGFASGPAAAQSMWGQARQGWMSPVAQQGKPNPGQGKGDGAQRGRHGGGEGHGRLSNDEREQLRRDLNRANREIYRPDPPKR